ncbi:hypothetical protein D918_07009 [Trichuris suis]|nr:hypothetical protein D918_07009 [Trichuris suis]
MESDSTKATIGTAAALSIRLPQFWAHSPKLWFSQAEAHFALRQVSSSQTKFYYAIAALPDHIASGVDDLLDPEPPNPYEALKAKLLRRFGETQDQRLQKLLHWSPGADQKPSQWLREMRRLLDNRGEQEGPLFRLLFLDRLPLNVQLLLKTSPLSDLDELAEKADELLALGDQLTVAAVDRRVSSDDLHVLRERLSAVVTTRDHCKRIASLSVLTTLLSPSVYQPTR